MNLPRLSFIALLLINIILGSCSSPGYRDIAITDSDTEYILDIVRRISGSGPHNAGTTEEEHTGDMIITELNSFGIDAEREFYTFQTFNLDNIILELGDSQFSPLFAGINPFEGPLSMNVELCFLDEEGAPDSAPEGKFLVSTNPDLFFMALQMGSKGFISLTPKEYEELRHLESSSAHIRVNGQTVSRTSSNIVANIGNHNDTCQSVYFTAHYDSYLGSPGANDNGTGVGGLLAMTRILKSVEKSLPFNVKFIFLSAEEVGLVGSREYVSTHLEELAQCKLVINFDTFGGNEGPYIATAKGQQGVPVDGIKNQLDPVLSNRALEGPEGKWRLFDPSLFPMVMSSNYPQWVQTMIDSVSMELEMEVFNRHLMSDHLIFAQAGVPAISIQSREHQIHSEEDTPEQINSHTVSSCFQLSWEILKHLFDS